MASYYLPSESKIGVGYVAHRFANVMVARGHHVTMFSPAPRPTDAAYSHNHMPLSGRLRTFRWPTVLRAGDFSGFDVLHAHGDDHLCVGRRFPAHVRTLHGSCFLEAAHVHGLRERLRMLALGLTELAATVVADETVGVSDNSLSPYPWLHRVIPNGVDTCRFTPGPKDADPTILFVGTFGGRKRGRLVVDAFRTHVLPRFPAARLWMVCEDSPPSPGVHVFGRVDDHTLADLYRRAWVFCLPSSYEGFGVPYVEALASGTPIVATPNPGAREVIGFSGAGRLVRRDELGTALLSLLGSSEERCSMAEAGLDRARAFSWEVVADSYESVYEELLRSRQA